MFNVSVLGEILFNTFNKCKVPHLDFENSYIQMKQTDINSSPKILVDPKVNTRH